MCNHDNGMSQENNLNTIIFNSSLPSSILHYHLQFFTIIFNSSLPDLVSSEHFHCLYTTEQKLYSVHSSTLSDVRLWTIVSVYLLNHGSMMLLYLSYMIEVIGFSIPNILEILNKTNLQLKKQFMCCKISLKSVSNQKKSKKATQFNYWIKCFLFHLILLTQLTLSKKY